MITGAIMNSPDAPDPATNRYPGPPYVLFPQWLRDLVRVSGQHCKGRYKMSGGIGNGISASHIKGYEDRELS